LDNLDVSAVEIGRSDNSVSSEIEKPGEYECNRKPEHDQEHDQTHHPARDIENGKNLGNTLREGPAGDHIRNRHGVNFPPL
jgi:hypothetical protein